MTERHPDIEPFRTGTLDVGDGHRLSSSTMQVTT
jgi:hypothetical protein